MGWRKIIFALIMFFLLPGLAEAGDAKASLRLGYAASMERHWATALTHYSKAIELNPRDVEAYFERAATLEVMGRSKEAMGDLERVLKLRPDHYLAIEYLAKLCEKDGQHSRAVALYAKALRLVRDKKWRSVVKVWMSVAAAKMKGPK